MTPQQYMKIVGQAQRTAMVNSIRTPVLEDAIGVFRKSITPADFGMGMVTSSFLKDIQAVQPTKYLPEFHDIPRAARLSEQMQVALSPAATKAAACFAGQLQDQNSRIVDIVQSYGVSSALANLSCTLPQGWKNQFSIFRDQIIDDIADDPEIAEERLRRLARDRQDIIKALYRFGLIIESSAYLPSSPVPHFVAFLVLVVVVLGEVADEILTEREDGG